MQLQDALPSQRCLTVGEKSVEECAVRARTHSDSLINSLVDSPVETNKRLRSSSLPRRHFLQPSG